MTKPGVIINPKSGRGRGKGLALAEKLKGKSGSVDLAVLQDFTELYPSLERMAASGVTHLFISSGDGTVQAIQTWICETGKFANFPALCLLPHGTTNMTAADLGFQRKPIDEQARFISELNPREIRKRATLRVANPKGRGALHGMFFGTGAVAEATRYCQVAFNDKGVGGNWATFATLATVAAKSIFLAPNPNDPNRFDKPYDITLDVDGNNICKGPQLLMLATTLEADPGGSPLLGWRHCTSAHHGHSLPRAQHSALDFAPHVWWRRTQGPRRCHQPGRSNVRSHIAHQLCH